MKNLFRCCRNCITHNNCLEVTTFKCRIFIAELASSNDLTWFYIFRITSIYNYFLAPNAIVFFHKVAFIYNLLFEESCITWIEDVVKNIPFTFELPGGVYNFGAENLLNTYETAAGYAKLLGCDPETFVVADTGRFPEHIRNISISMQKAYDASCGKIKFMNTLEGLEEYLKQH